MNDLISIKKVTVDNHDHAAVKFNVFSLIVAAIRPLKEEQKHIFVQSIKDNMSKLDLVKLSNETQNSL